MHFKLLTSGSDGDRRFCHLWCNDAVKKWGLFLFIKKCTSNGYLLLFLVDFYWWLSLIVIQWDNIVGCFDFWKLWSILLLWWLWHYRINCVNYIPWPRIMCNHWSILSCLFFSSLTYLFPCIWLLRPEQIRTVAVGAAVGQACLLLAAGTPGKRFMLPHAKGIVWIQ